MEHRSGSVEETEQLGQALAEHLGPGAVVAFTGDLGAVGSELLYTQLRREGCELANHLDCGCLLYDRDEQPVQAGGSGAGCSAAVLGAYILPQLQSGRWRRVLFVATGALMSRATILQGESIPGIAHAVELIAPKGEREG